MKLIILTNLFPNLAEPLRSTFNEQQVLALSRQEGVDVNVIAPIDWLRKLKIRSQAKKISSTDKRWKNIPVSYPTYFHIPKANPAIFGPLMFVSVLFSWMKIKKTKDSVVYSIWAYPDGFTSLLLARLSRLPVVVSVIGSDVDTIMGNYWLKKMTVWTLSRVDRVTAVSDALRDKLIANGVPSEKVVTLKNGVDKSLFTVKSNVTVNEQKQGYLLFVGNFLKDKGVYDLLEAFERLLSKYPTLKLKMLGDGKEFNQVQGHIESKGLSSTVELLGRVTPDVVSDTMRNAVCLVLPSYHEGIPNVIVEAMHTGLPVVSTKIGGIPEIINGHNGVLVTPGDIDALFEALSHTVTKQWDVDVLRKYADELPSWDETAEMVVDVFKQM